MKLPFIKLFHHKAEFGKPAAGFPIGDSHDYSAIKRISRSEIEKWPCASLQMLMDYCLSKEIFETAAIIRDAAYAKGFKLHTA